MCTQLAREPIDGSDAHGDRRDGLVVVVRVEEALQLLSQRGIGTTQREAVAIEGRQARAVREEIEVPQLPAHMVVASIGEELEDRCGS